MKTKQPSVLTLFSSKLSGNLTVLSATFVFSWLNQNWWWFFTAVLALVAILAYRYFRVERTVNTDSSGWSREELRDALRLAEANVDGLDLKVKWLEESVARLSSERKNSDLRDEVLRMIAVTLITYDQNRNEVSAAETLEALRELLTQVRS